MARRTGWWVGLASPWLLFGCDPAPAPTNTGSDDTDTDVLMVEGAPFHIQGVAWNPVAKGDVHPAGLDFAGFVDQDSALMARAGINVVRTYEPLTDTDVLDTLYARGIYVVNTVYASGAQSTQVVRDRVEAVMDHPAIVMWVIGNEWNYNGLYVGLDLPSSIERVGEAARVIERLDTGIPIATVYGGSPSRATVNALPEIDVWGINYYGGLTFSSLFDTWSATSDKPMFLAEFGADAWNADLGKEDQPAQAEATAALISEIEDNAAIRDQGPCMGGVVFEWADEWWKDGDGQPDEHDIGGIAPGGGPHPDFTFNEEWWGLVDIDRVPRQALDAVTAAWAD